MGTALIVILPISLIVLTLLFIHHTFKNYCDPVDAKDCKDCPYKENCKFKIEVIRNDIR